MLLDPEQNKSHVVDAGFLTLPTSPGSGGQGVMVVKHCQRHNGSKTLNTLTQSTRTLALVQIFICSNCKKSLILQFVVAYSQKGCHMIMKVVDQLKALNKVLKLNSLGSLCVWKCF